MRKIRFVFQELLKFVLIFSLMFIWTRYFCKKLSVAIVLALIFSAIAYIVMLLITRKKQNKLNLKMKEKEDAENMFLSLACDENAIDFFAQLASKKHALIEKKSQYLIIRYEETNAKTLLYFLPDFQGLNSETFMQIYRKTKQENASKIVICCKEIADKQLSTFVLNFKEKFLLFDQYETYKQLFKFYNFFPKITQSYSKTKKMAIKDFFAYSFNKKRTKGYLFSAFLLILSGLFVRASLYYCIVASLLVVFAIISQFNPYFNVKSEEEVL